MSATKLVNLLALLTLAVLACSLGPTPVNAVSHLDGQHARAHAGHAAVAKKRRGNTNRRCRTRTSSLVASSTPVVHSSSSSSAAPPPPSTTANPQTTQQPQQAPEKTTKQSSQAPQATPPTTVASSGGKAGMATDLNNADIFKNFHHGRLNIIYNWSCWVPDAAKKLGYETMCMLWGTKQIDDFLKNTNVGYRISDWLMGPNEPDQKGQSNMSPADAANLVRTYLTPLKNKYGYKIVGPACTSAPNSIQWQKDFMAACSDCEIDVMALHYYGTNADDFKSYVTTFHNTFGYPLMVTEFSCMDFGTMQGCSDSGAKSFMLSTTNWMDSQSYVVKYFYFGILWDLYNVAYTNQLLSGTSPNDKGWAYINGY